MEVKAVFYIQSMEERRIAEALKSRNYMDVNTYFAEEGGQFLESGTIVEIICEEEELPEAEETLREISEAVVRIGTFELYGLGDIAYKIKKSLNAAAYTPQNLVEDTDIEIEQIARVLPSSYNKMPYMNPYMSCVYDKYKLPDRIIVDIDTSDPRKWEMVVDDSYKWRFFTAFSFKKQKVEAKVDRLYREMNRATERRRKNAEEMTKRIVDRISRTFEMSKEEMESKFIIAIVGSALRGDATKYADLDMLFIWDDHAGFERVITDKLFEKDFTPSMEQVNELKLKSIVYEEILRMEDKEKLHVSFHPNSLYKVRKDIERKMALVPFMLSTSKPIFGKPFHKSLNKEVKKSEVYKQIQNQISEKYSKMRTEEDVNYTDFIYKIKIGEDPAKDIQKFEVGGEMIRNDLKVINEFLNAYKLEVK